MLYIYNINTICYYKPCMLCLLLVALHVLVSNHKGLLVGAHQNITIENLKPFLRNPLVMLHHY